MRRIAMVRVSWAECPQYRSVLIFTPSRNGLSGERIDPHPRNSNRGSNRFGGSSGPCASGFAECTLISHGSRPTPTFPRKGNECSRKSWQMSVSYFKANLSRERNCGENENHGERETPTLTVAIGEG